MVDLGNTFFKLREWLSDEPLITDLIAKFTVTFGVIFIVGGLYLMLVNPDPSSYVAQATGNRVVLSVVEWIPGLPFYVGDLAGINSVVAGSAYWIAGVDLLLVGLGLWVRHKLARYAGILVFSLAAFFQFIQFLLLGLVGSPMSVLAFLVDALFAYFLFAKFDKPPATPLSLQQPAQQRFSMPKKA
jgi:hypothetical protein